MSLSRNMGGHKLHHDYTDAPPISHGRVVRLSNPNFTRGPMLKCGICQEPFQPLERITYHDDEKCHVGCVLDYHGISIEDEL